MTLVQRFPNASQNYDAQNEAQFRNMVRQALSDTSSPVILTEVVGQSFQGEATVGNLLVHDGVEFRGTDTISGDLTFSGSLTFTGTTNFTAMATFSLVDINGGNIDGTAIGATTPSSGIFTTLNATGGGALTGTWSDLGVVTTVDINGGSIDGTPIGAAVPSTGAFSSVDIDGGTLDGVTIGGTTPGSAAFTALKLGNQTITGNTTLDAQDCVVLVDASSNAVTVTLPTAAAGDQILYHIKRIDNAGYLVEIDGDGSETIDGSLKLQLLTMDSVTITSDGTEWFIL